MPQPRLAPALLPVPLGVLLVLLAACQGAPKGPLPSAGTAVVPLAESSCLIFGREGSERLDGTRRAPFPSPAPRAVPLCAATDSASGWSALGYADTLLVVDAAEERVRRIDDVQWDRPPQVLGIHGTIVGTIEDGTIALYDALGGRRLWKADGRALLRGLGLEELRYVQPITPERMLVVAFKRMDVFAKPQAMILDLDRSSGVPVAQERPFGDALHWLEACVGDGQTLYVAGTTQHVENVGPRQQQMTKTVVVLRHDPTRGQNQVVVRAQQAPQTEVRVRTLAAGWDLLALALEDGRVEVYDATGTREYSRLWRSLERGVSGLACVDREHVAIVSGDQVRIQRVR